jgi:hypothetical protein
MVNFLPLSFSFEVLKTGFEALETSFKADYNRRDLRWIMADEV